MEEKKREAIIYIYLKKTNLILISEMVENFSRKKMETVKKKKRKKCQDGKEQKQKFKNLLIGFKKSVNLISATER